MPPSNTLIEFVLLGVFKKNCQNNQMITLLCDKTNPTICPVLAALRLVLRARCLSQPDSMPVACYLKKDAMAYITGSRIALHFQAAARAVRPNISKDDKQQYSAHSTRVWAWFPSRMFDAPARRLSWRLLFAIWATAPITVALPPTAPRSRGNFHIFLHLSRLKSPRCREHHWLPRRPVGSSLATVVHLQNDGGRLLS